MDIHFKPDLVPLWFPFRSFLPIRQGIKDYGWRISASKTLPHRLSAVHHVNLLFRTLSFASAENRGEKIARIHCRSQSWMLPVMEKEDGRYEFFFFKSSFYSLFYFLVLRWVTCFCDSHFHGIRFIGRRCGKMGFCKRRLGFAILYQALKNLLQSLNLKKPTFRQRVTGWGREGGWGWVGVYAKEVGFEFGWLSRWISRQGLVMEVRSWWR